ncbi:MAG: MBL fold metallo-hydrolase [Ramlibacter sp.]
MPQPNLAIEPFFDPTTSTVTYVVADTDARVAAVIDPVLDFDAKSGRTGTGSADRVLAHLDRHGLRLDWILETHAHADHLSGAAYLRRRAGGRVAIGERIGDVQRRFGGMFGIEPPADAFDHLFRDGERFRIGGIEAEALLVPGHTPADLAYRVGDDCVFVGDTLFMPDVGTARADFPGGDARTLYRSIRKLLALPPRTRLFVCHDYPPPGRGPQWETSVAEQRNRNIHVHDGVDEDAFVRMRTARDATLQVPTLILPSLQVNVCGGRMPAKEANGIAYLRIPLDALPAHAGA